MTPGSNGDRRRRTTPSDAQRARAMERFVGNVEDLVWASCVSCQRKRRGPVCEAYPGGIPEVILRRQDRPQDALPGGPGAHLPAGAAGGRGVRMRAPGTADEVRLLEQQAPEVPAEWFLHFSELHGVRHTQRVHVHARRLA